MNEQKTTAKNNIVSIVIVLVILGGLAAFIFLKQNTPLRATEKQFRKVCDQYHKNELTDIEFIVELNNLENRAAAISDAAHKNGSWGETSGGSLYHDIYMLRLGVQADGYAAFLKEYDTIKKRYKP